jgi:hypothetical protein
LAEFWYSISEPVKKQEGNVKLHFIKTHRELFEQIWKYVRLFLVCVHYYMEISRKEEQIHLRTISMRCEDIAVLREFSNSVNLQIVTKS